MEEEELQKNEMTLVQALKRLKHDGEQMGSEKQLF